MKTKYIFLALAALALASCNDYDVINKEQYKHVFAFISDADHINGKVFSLDSMNEQGYFSISMGGSTATDKDLTVNLVEDPEVLSKYNLATYEYKTSKYAHQLPAANYEISSLKCVVKAGDSRGVVPVTIYPEGLSPDSTYFIPLRIESYDDYEVNPKRNYLLYKVTIKNRWASANGASVYNMMTLRTEGTVTLRMPGTKAIYPVSSTTVRTMAANEDFGGDLSKLEKFGIYIDIAEDGQLTLRPYRDIELVQVNKGDEGYDADYPNKYFLDSTEYSSYHTFLLHYKYKSGSTWYDVKEELRMQAPENNQ